MLCLFSDLIVPTSAMSHRNLLSQQKKTGIISYYDLILTQSKAPIFGNMSVSLAEMRTFCIFQKNKSMIQRTVEIAEDEPKSL
jgi:hypothetical protein